MSNSQGPKIRVLVADADQVFRETLTAILGLEDDLQIVGTAALAGQALSATLSLRPDVAVLASPLRGLATLPLTIALRHQLPTCAVVVIATHPGESLNELLSKGVRAVLRKEAQGQEVAACIRAVHGGGRYVDPESITEAIRHRNRT
ncbi:hypothetical protein [Streptomyces sp. NPDC006463]|uniref:hypothetical protein n=1 Tax=Streptomyces sp. NPDC006463 TaxID=3364746 RepID=UPI0036AB694C